ncbi:neuronal acetylcholine receptor subunit alpha-7-like [Gigantopelta aegis]|uniref:neuronal acetylcholine receptor subunit alpha-7-like n=1 Tax=Gigantopelta aegis TaxID=1735272 RepID=UPI001B88B4AE|nr:neuronal acetylcholine receptor subunit alpha-7-like [Gigantopelta aegis]
MYWRVNVAKYLFREQQYCRQSGETGDYPCGFLTVTLQRVHTCCQACALYSPQNSFLLRRDLFNNYSQLDRPKSVTKIKVLFHLITINDLNTRAMSFSVTGWFFMIWQDSRLSWDSTVYNDIGYVYASENEIWTPPIIVDNSVNDLRVISDKRIPIRVNAKGKVHWNPPGIYLTQCDIAITYYPFDTQHCTIVLRTVGYTLREVNLTVFGDGINAVGYETNGEWDLIATSAYRFELSDDNDLETYSSVAVSFTLKRRPLYYGINIILPTFVLSVLSAVVFVVPVDSGEKMGYSLTVLLSITVFLTIVSSSMPTTSQNTSIMAIYISVVLLLSGTSVILTTLVLGLYFRDENRPVPTFVQALTNCWLVRLSCFRKCHPSAKVKDVGDFPRNNNGSDAASGVKHTLPETPPSGSDKAVTWKDVSKALDAFCFRLHLFVYIVFTVVIFVCMS